MTDRNPHFDLQAVNTWNEDGLWVTAFDSEGMEVEVELKGFTPERADSWRSS